MYPRRYTGDHLRLNMSDNEDEQPNPPPPPPPAQGTVKLSPFWPQAPALWFAQAECTFAVNLDSLIDTVTWWRHSRTSL